MLLCNSDRLFSNVWDDLESITDFVVGLKALKSYFWNYREK